MGILKTKEIELNDSLYELQQMGGSWNLRLSSMKYGMDADGALADASFGELEAGSEAHALARLAVYAKRFESAEKASQLKEILMAGVANPNWTPETYENYFQGKFKDQIPLFDAIIDYNIGEGEAKKKDLSSSENRPQDQ